MMINSEYIFLDKDFKTKNEVISFISQQSTLKGIGNDKKNLENSFFKREKEGSTGMMDGFAIPHAKSDSITKPAVMIVRLNSGVDWDSMDGEPVDFVIALLIPEDEAGTTHLKILSTIARALMTDDFKKRIREINNTEEMTNEFKSIVE